MRHLAIHAKWSVSCNVIYQWRQSHFSNCEDQHTGVNHHAYCCCTGKFKLVTFDSLCEITTRWLKGTFWCLLKCVRSSQHIKHTQTKSNNFTEKSCIFSKKKKKRSTKEGDKMHNWHDSKVVLNSNCFIIMTIFKTWKIRKKFPTTQAISISQGSHSTFIWNKYTRD